MPKKTLKDTKKLTDDVSGIGHLGNGDYQIKITSNKNLKYILGLVKQSFKYHNNKKKVLSGNKASPKKTIKKQSKTPVRSYTQKYHFEKRSKDMKVLYKKFKSGVLRLDKNITIKYNKHYIAFATKSNIVCIGIQRNQLKMLINTPKGKLKDPKKITNDVSNKGRHGTGDYRVYISSDENLKYVLGLVEQTLDYRKNNE